MLSKESYKDVLSSSRAPATPIVPQINNERDSDSTMDDQEEVYWMFKLDETNYLIRERKS